MNKITACVASMVCALVLAGCGGGSAGDGGGGSAGSAGRIGSSAQPTPSAPSSVSTSSRAASPSPTPTPTPVDPGTLPQTQASPTGASPLWQSKVNALWTAIRTGNPPAALPAFFPLAAYRQIKAISDPAGDWNDRLVHLYTLDIEALHTWLGPNATSAQLVSVDVPANGTWVLPGQEYNSGSYWRVYGTRVHVVSGGRERSFGIASLISWRGEWYVVHLGPITRSAPVGAVSDASG